MSDEQEFFIKHGLIGDISEIEKYVGLKFICSRCNEGYTTTFDTLGYCPKCQKYFDRLMKRLREAVGYCPSRDYKIAEFWLDNDWIVLDSETGDLDQEATIEKYKSLRKKDKDRSIGTHLTLLKHKLLILKNLKS